MPGELPADVAELDFAVAAPIRQALLRGIALSDFGYPDFSQGTPITLKQVFAERMRRQYGWRPSPDRMELSAQITQALCCVILAFTRPGDAVLTHTPTYPPFVAAIRDLGRILVTIPVADLAAPEQLVGMLPPGVPIRLVVLCQPHNPTGQVFGKSALAALAALANAHDAQVFSDEIYQDLVLDPVGHTPVALTPGLGARTITFTSAAKSFNIPGLRCAVGHFGSSRLHEIYRRLPWHLRDGASLTGVSATLAAWRYGSEWLAELRQMLLSNRAVMEAAVAELHGVMWKPPAAGFLAWLDFAGTAVAANPPAALRKQAGVRLQPGTAFGSACTSYARLNFGTSPERLLRIVDRIRRVLHQGI